MHKFIIEDNVLITIILNNARVDKLFWDELTNKYFNALMIEIMKITIWDILSFEIYKGWLAKGYKLVVINKKWVWKVL